MRIGEVARRAGVTVKAVRYYESLGLVVAGRLHNGYRDYGDADVRRIAEVSALGRLGITAEASRPFLDCLDTGAAAGDDCPASLDTYREAIADLDARMAELAARRATLVRRLADATARRAAVAPRCELVPEEQP